jgi:outer membrane protein
LAAAKHGRDAAEWETVVADSRARLAGKIAFYEWIRANASVEAAKQSVTEQRAHLTDVTNQVSEGNASRADALRVDSAVASAEATLAEADAQQATAEARLRTLLHLSDSASLTTHDAVNAPLGSITQNKAEWLSEVYRTRAELRGLDAAESAARAQASVARATYVPTVGAFANAMYANPNPRHFPPDAAWRATWAVGVAVTWTPTDIPGAHAGAFEADARGDVLAAQRNALRDALAVEVVQYFESVRAADANIVATDKQLESASEAHRVTRSLFANARATTSNLLDAETDLARARFAWVNARVDARVARARLEHAAGRDQHAPAP